MRNLIFAFVIFICVHNVNAQTNYLSPNLNWTYLQCSIDGPYNCIYGDSVECIQIKRKIGSTYHYSLSGDTIINGTVYYKLYNNNSYVLAIRMDSVKKVYRLTNLDTHEDLLYNYSAVIGDTFCSNPINTVVKYDSILINNITKKRFILSDNDTVIEDIGNINRIMGNYFIPNCDPCSIVFTLLCFKKDDSLNYINKQYKTCDTTFYVEINLGIKENKTANYFKISNPVNNELKVFYQLQDLERLTLKITDIFGHELKSMTINNNETEIILDVSRFTAGTYLINVVNKQAICILHTKFIKVNSN